MSAYQSPRRCRSILSLSDDGELQIDEQLKSRFEQVLQHYAAVIKERDDTLLREKKAREQFEASFRAAVDKVILPAATQAKELAAPTNWICAVTKSDNGLSAKRSRARHQFVMPERRFPPPKSAEQEAPMDQRIESFLTDVLALAGKDPEVVRQGVRVALREEFLTQTSQLPNRRLVGAASFGHLHKQGTQTQMQSAKSDLSAAALSMSK
jgi:hypothetical protein